MKINKRIIEEKIKDSAIIYQPHGRGHKKIQMKVSPHFIDEYISFVMTGIEKNVAEIAESVYIDKKRKTLQDKDVIHFFGFVDRKTISISDE